MPNRTKTYIAGEWDGDRDLIDQLKKWNESNFWGLHFLDAHDLCESRDTSLKCTIKESLRERLARSKTFVLIAGENTISATAGGCRWCDSYDSYSHRCHRGRVVDHRSFIEFECEYALRNIPKIVVLYNYCNVYEDRCPEVLRSVGTHVPARRWTASGEYGYDYTAVKKAIEG